MPTVISGVALTLCASQAALADTQPIIPSSPSCVVTLVSGDPSTAPPAPTCYDPSGSDEDEFLVPYYIDSSGNVVSYEDGNYNPYSDSSPNSTNGASQVFIQSTHYDPSTSMYVNGAAWTLSFPNSAPMTPTPNTFSITVGNCVTSALSGRTVRQVTAYVTNNAGPDARYIGSVYPYASGDNGDVGVNGTVQATRVFDGDTVGIPLVAVAGGPSDEPGLNGGHTYVVKFFVMDTSSTATSNDSNTTVQNTQSVYVPPCGSTPPGPPTPTVRPSAKIVVVHATPLSRAKVYLGSAKASVAKYVVTVDPRRGTTLRQVFLTSSRLVTYRRLKRGTVVTVRFGTHLLRKTV